MFYALHPVTPAKHERRQSQPQSASQSDPFSRGMGSLMANVTEALEEQRREEEQMIKLLQLGKDEDVMAQNNLAVANVDFRELRHGRVKVRMNKFLMYLVPLAVGGGGSLGLLAVAYGSRRAYDMLAMVLWYSLFVYINWLPFKESALFGLVRRHLRVLRNMCVGLVVLNVIIFYPTYNTLNIEDAARGCRWIVFMGSWLVIPLTLLKFRKMRAQRLMENLPPVPAATRIHNAPNASPPQTAASSSGDILPRVLADAGAIAPEGAVPTPPPSPPGGTTPLPQMDAARPRAQADADRSSLRSPRNAPHLASGRITDFPSTPPPSPPASEPVVKVTAKGMVDSTFSWFTSMQPNKVRAPRTRRGRPPL